MEEGRNVKRVENRRHFYMPRKRERESLIRFFVKVQTLLSTAVIYVRQERESEQTLTLTTRPRSVGSGGFITQSDAHFSQCILLLLLLSLSLFLEAPSFVKDPFL